MSTQFLDYLVPLPMGCTPSRYLLAEGSLGIRDQTSLGLETSILWDSSNHEEDLHVLKDAEVKSPAACPA